MYECWYIKGHCLEYFDDTHTYLYDCYITLPSVTECLKMRFGNKYGAVDRVTLQRAAERGTEVHKAIEDYCKNGTESDLQEIRGFKFLQKNFGFEVLANEIPVILFADDEPILAGRLDMVMRLGDKIGLGDIKTTSVLDKEYLGYQLNLYRIAYQQCYGERVDFLKGVHLRADKRKVVEIPINEPMMWEYINEWRKRDEQGTFDGSLGA